MRISFELTFDDYTEACRAMSSVKQVAGSRLFYAVAYATVAFGFLFLITRFDGGGPVAPLCLIAIGFFMLVHPIYTAYRDQAEAWRESERLRGSVTIHATSDALTWEGLHINVQYSWNAFYRVLETRNLFLIYQTSTQLGLIIPKRAFDENELKEFQLLLEEKISLPNHGFPVITST
jgi:hypothetical protein